MIPSKMEGKPFALTFSEILHDIALFEDDVKRSVSPFQCCYIVSSFMLCIFMSYYL